jgi:phosphohistidine phosphatase
MQRKGSATTTRGALRPRVSARHAQPAGRWPHWRSRPTPALPAPSRASDTAELACEALELEPEITEGLRGGPFDSTAFAAGRGDVILVGHEPDFSSEVARLTGAKVKLPKGGLAVIDGNTLVALLRPKDLAAIADA